VNIPNALTVSRLVAIPVLMALLLLRFPGHDQVAAALFIAFSLTDTVDGQLARRSGTVSDLGKFLDPLADKLFVLAVLIVLVQEGLVAAWVVVVIFSRELIITILRSVGASQGRVIAAAPLGKTKTVTQMAAVTLLILQRPYPVLVPIADIAVAAAVVFTLGSGLDYLWRFRHLLVPVDTSRIRLGPSGGAPEPSLAGELSDALRQGGLTVAVAESLTGGLVGSRISEAPGSSEIFKGSIVSYATEVKRSVLGVTAEHVVSAECALQMAEGARRVLGADVGLAVTGVAGPTEQDGQPVGTVYFGLAMPGHEPEAVHTRLPGNRMLIRQFSTISLLNLARLRLLGLSGPGVL